MKLKYLLSGTGIAVAGGFAYWWFFMRKPSPILLTIARPDARGDLQAAFSTESTVDFQNYIRKNFTPQTVEIIEKFLHDSRIAARKTDQRIYIKEIPSIVIKIEFKQAKQLAA